MAENENAPATKKDLAAIETRLDVRMDSLSAQMHALEESLSEQMRDMQTELLKGLSSLATGRQDSISRARSQYGE